MLAIAWEYLTGQTIATDTSNREAAEWPPHPDRVFMALVAAWGETGQDRAQRAALEWLEQLPPPQLSVPVADDLGSTVIRQPVHTVFVPVNDLTGPKGDKYDNENLLGLIPAYRGAHGGLKGRNFPTVFVGTTVCALIWPEVTPSEEQRAALAQLCRAMTHIGHSHAMVRAWLSEDPPPATLVPGSTSLRSGGMKLRVPDRGRLHSLTRAYGTGGRGWQRPPTARWQSFVPLRAERHNLHGAFDDRLLVFRWVAGDQLGLAQTLAFTEAFRGTLLGQAVSPRAKALISGHDRDGAAAQTPHLAYLPLPFVGHPHADGHLLGMALALPAGLAAEDEQDICDAVVAAMHAEAETIELVAGKAGAATLVHEDRPAPPLALRAQTWTAEALQWATVTPIALDRLPPRRHRDTDAWAADQIALACQRQGLPAPAELKVLPVSPHEGVPHARTFPPLLRKPDLARRWHTHAWLRFDTAISGPLLLGAGRYRGYGLCKPLLS